MNGGALADQPHVGAIGALRQDVGVSEQIEHRFARLCVDVESSARVGYGHRQIGQIQKRLLHPRYKICQASGIGRGAIVKHAITISNGRACRPGAIRACPARLLSSEGLLYKVISYSQVFSSSVL